MFTSLCRPLTCAAVAVAASISLFLTAPAPAHAAPVTDYNGSLISWPSVNQCSDSSYYGTRVYAQPTFRTPSTGYYGVQMFLLTSSGRTVDYTPFTKYSRLQTPPINIRFPYWGEGAYAFYGETFVVAYVYKWNGSAYQSVAREYLPCF